MFEIPYGRTARLPVILQDATGSFVNNVAAAGVTLSIMKASGQSMDITVSASEWTQLTGAAYSGRGYYNLLLSSTYVDATGVMQYCIYNASAQPYFGVVKVAYDTNMVYDRIGQPVSGTISNDIQNVPVAAASGGFTAQDRAWLSATYYTSSLLPSDPASNSYLSGIVATSFGAADRADILTIKNKTNNLPSDPASNNVIYVGLTATSNVVDAYTLARINEVKGTSWGTSASLDKIYVHVSSTWLSGARIADLSGARDYLAGASFITGTDDLHGISVQIQGITPSSGGGGFSTTDRAMLVTAYSQTLALPTDPASNSYVSGIITASAARIMGSGSFGGQSGSTLWEAVHAPNVGLNYVAGKVFYLPTTTVASQNDIIDIKGTGWNSTTDTLHTMSLMIQSQSFSASFTPTDRVWLSSTFVSSSIIYNTELQIKNKTDNLPVDPVSTAHIDPQLDAIFSASSVSGGFSVDDRNNIIGIKAKTDNLPAQPADATVTFGTTDRTKLDQVYTKTSALPADPVSQAYVLLVSQSLDILIRNTSSSLGSGVSTVSASIQVVSASIQDVSSSILSLSTKIGTPSTTVAGDIIDIGNQLGGIATNSSNAANYSQAASAAATTAATNSTTAAINTTTIISSQTAMDTKLGTPKSGSMSADIKDIRDNISGGGGGSSGSVDLGPVMKILGTPNKTISDDLRQVGKIVQDIQKKVT